MPGISRVLGSSHLLCRPTWASPARAGLVELAELKTTLRCPKAGIARAQRESGGSSVGRRLGLGDDR